MFSESRTYLKVLLIKLETKKYDQRVMETKWTTSVYLYGSIQGTLLDGNNVGLNWNIESDMNIHWI